MMLDLIAFHARRAPNALAFYVDGRELTYREALAGLCRLIEALRPLPISPGQLVGIACPNDYCHLMMMFALEALGAIALPFAQPTDPGIEKVLHHCDLLIAPVSIPVDRPFVSITPDWVRGILESTAQVEFTVHPVPVPGYVLTTSGSTGAAKAMLLDANALRLREHDRIWQYGLNRTSRFVVATPISVGGVYSTARACLRIRGCVIFQAGMSAEIVLPLATHIVLLPIHVRQLVDVLPAGYRPAEPLHLISMGARLPATLRSRAVARLNAIVHDGYGANETGPISVVDADGIGDVLPGVEVQIVDEAGASLPTGATGLILVQSSSQVTRYLDAEHTKRYLRDGWFHTGDLGRLHAHRRLQVLGRPDAMLNIGGLKVAPEEIEDVLIQNRIARDAAVCTRPGPDGIDELYVGLESPVGDDKQMMAAVAAHVGGNFGHVRIVRFAKIPRGASGKVLRAELQQMIDAALHESK